MLNTPAGTDTFGFKFLDYYTEDDRDIFRGRDQDVFEITSRLSSRSSLVIYGPSGTGKTSLVLAGVFPAAKSLGWRPVYIRTLIDPANDLKDSIVKQLNISDDDSKASAYDVIQKASSESPILIVLDQFEEFFIRFHDDPSARQRFIDLMHNLARDQNVPCRFLFRADSDHVRT